jgi:hypothetical protein
MPDEAYRVSYYRLSPRDSEFCGSFSKKRATSQLLEVALLLLMPNFCENDLITSTGALEYAVSTSPWIDDLRICRVAGKTSDLFQIREILKINKPE